MRSRTTLEQGPCHLQTIFVSYCLWAVYVFFTSAQEARTFNIEIHSWGRRI